jgi:hypothetical protein
MFRAKDKTIVREKALHARRTRILTTYPETGMAKGLGLRIPGPCCLAIDVGGGAVVRSSTSPGEGGWNDGWGHYGPWNDCMRGVTGPSFVFPAAGGR